MGRLLSSIRHHPVVFFHSGSLTPGATAHCPNIATPLLTFLLAFARFGLMVPTPIRAPVFPCVVAVEPTRLCGDTELRHGDYGVWSTY